MTFSVYSPFGSIPDPATDGKRQMREGLLPPWWRGWCWTIPRARRQDGDVCDEITRVPARGFSPTIWVRAAWASPSGVRPEELPELKDFTSSKKGAKIAAEPFVFMRWSASDGVREKHNPVHCSARVRASALRSRRAKSTD